MVSDSELVGRLRDFLRTSDLTTTTTATIRRRLEEDFGIDLSDKKAFIREQVDLFLQSQVDNAQENEEEDEGEVNEEEEDDDDEEEEASNGKSTSKRGSKKQNKEVKKRGGGGGFTKLCSLSPELQKFVGVPELARTEVVKQLWNYIREKNLQDPSNRRNIICDDTLRALFAVDCINMFQMNKSLAKHIWPLDSDDASVKSTPKEKPQKQKQRKQEREDDSDDEPKRKEKRQKGGNSGFLAPLPLSDALVKFLGTGESSLSRSEVVKRIWQYIKQNNLQDPSDKRRIISDEKLRELFDVDSFNGFTVSKLLTTHFMKTEH
ncbi:hypothetical protein CsSME_00003775 [Camellia sinensis var. sinensis]|uniref:DM2 domain-containing protein n=1 Tax=Camellia sinensis var. sinensis TaxID=542762 RepID=A0A4S4EWG5_CAMSN|nr:upstream activation factor subunit spp27-like isoform X2 [Camellia sinensis]THG20726.1 hypothetical protein TEA_005833 [Camellia sinensis var. sinensis]